MAYKYNIFLKLGISKRMGESLCDWKEKELLDGEYLVIFYDELWINKDLMLFRIKSLT